MDAKTLEDAHEAFTEGLAALNAADTPTMNLPVHVGNARHGCSKARQSGPEGRQISTALLVKEVYAFGWNEDGSPITEDDGTEFAYLYKEGRCSKCKYTGRSKVGRTVRVEDRPPAFGRVGRE